MLGSGYFGQNYLGQGYAGDQSAVVYTFADVSETTILVTTGVRRVRSAKQPRSVGLTTERRTIAETS
jgi:hypothetical protein